MVVVLVLLTIATLLTVDYLVQRRSAQRTPGAVRPGLSLAFADGEPLPAELLSVPGHTYLAPVHSWVRPESDLALRVGAGRLPLYALGRPDGLVLPPIGSPIRAGDPLATLRRGGRRLTLRSPVDGVVETINRAAENRPEQISDQPFGDGWLCTIRPRSLAGSLRRLLVAEEATAWMRRELARLRDVVAALSQPGGGAAPLMTDGGIPLEGLAGRLDEAGWMQVQQRFFDVPPTS